MIQLNVLYSGKVIAQQLFKIRPSTFSAKRQQYLEHLGKYYQFEQVGKKIRLIRQIKPFETKMQKREQKKEENIEIYRDLTHKIIEYKPRNTGSNIAREIDFSQDKPIKNHKQSTIVNYIRPILKEDFQVVGKEWSATNISTNEYELLTCEQLAYLMDLFKSRKLNQQILNITADYKCGNISKQEFQERVGNVSQMTYDKIMEIFKKKWGFKPYKVPTWKLKENKEKGLKFG